MKKEEIKLLDVTIFITIIFIFNLFVSIILTYNDKLKKANEKPLFDKKEVKTIENLNRFILLIIAVVYVWITYRQYKINQFLKKEKATKSSLINLIINDIQLISVIVILILPFIYPDDEEEEVVFP